MKKVIKLNEKDIENLVTKIIKEEKVNEDLPRRERALVCFRLGARADPEEG